MKKSALAIAAVLALTGAAFAENPNVGGSRTNSQKAPVTLDVTTTGSVHNATVDTATQPRLGYEGNPWFIGDIN